MRDVTLKLHDLEPSLLLGILEHARATATPDGSPDHGEIITRLDHVITRLRQAMAEQ